MLTGERKLVTWIWPVVSGVMSVTGEPFIRPASRFCKFGSAACPCARNALDASAAAASRRGSMNPLLATYMPLDLQEFFRVPAEDLRPIFRSERYVLHPAHAGW